MHPENTVTYSAGTEVKIFVGFSLKRLPCRDPAFPPLKAIRTVSYFPAESAHVHHSIYHVVVDIFSCVVVQRR